MIHAVGALLKGAPCAADFIDDFLSGLVPDERLRVVVVLRDVVKDGFNQLWHTCESTATHALVIQVTKEPLDDIEPGTAGRNEVDVEPLVPFQPCKDFGVFMRGVVVSDEMKVEVARGFCVDLLQEPDPLLVPVAAACMTR